MWGGLGLGMLLVISLVVVVILRIRFSCGLLIFVVLVSCLNL